MAPSPILVGIDTGGTFTDFVALSSGRVRTHKVLSTPHDPAEAVLAGLDELLAGETADVVTYGSTVATNALLERKGARVTLLTTAGFEDVVEIGRQNRPGLYDPEPHRVPPLVERADRIGVDERLLYDGSVATRLSLSTLRRLRARLRRDGPESVAICLLHAYANPVHEKQLAELVEAMGLPTSVSSELVAEYREYERCSTTVINAYVAPVMRRHLDKLMAGVPARQLRVLQSNGGAIPASVAGREAVRTALSGPAGGVIGAWRVASALGLTRIVTFDMGGTSTDVSLLAGAPAYRTEWEIGGLPVKVPAIDIHTVGAGGGSIAHVDAGGALKVGPESAGADPGPACYGRGDQPAVTDANLVLGRLSPEAFLGGRMTLDAERSRKVLARLARQLRISWEDAAEGVQRVVNASMERAIRCISVERGHDPREYALMAFGGAAGQHACELAEGLGMRRVILPAHAGVLSAWGALRADRQRDYVQTVRLIAPRMQDLRASLAPMRQRAADDMRRDGARPGAIRYRTSVDVRYAGQSYEIPLDLGAGLVDRFHAAHEALYGYADRERPLEVVNLRLSASEPGAEVPTSRERRSEPIERSRIRARWNGRWRAIGLVRRSDLGRGASVCGPALISEMSATTCVPPGWTAVMRPGGHLEVRRED